MRYLVMLKCIRVQMRKCAADHNVPQRKEEKKTNPLHGALYRVVEFEDAGVP